MIVVLNHTLILESPPQTRAHFPSKAEDFCTERKPKYLEIKTE